MMPEMKRKDRNKETERKRHSWSINLPEVPEYKGWGMNSIHAALLENKLYLV